MIGPPPYPPAVWGNARVSRRLATKGLRSPVRQAVATRVRPTVRISSRCCVAPFGESRPAATMLVCGLADPRMKIEIEVEAYARRPA